MEVETVVRCRSIFASFGGIFLYYLLVLFCKKRRGHDLKHRWFHLLNLIPSLLFARMKALQSFKFLWCKESVNLNPMISHHHLVWFVDAVFLIFFLFWTLLHFTFPKTKGTQKKKKKVKKNKWIRRKYP